MAPERGTLLADDTLAGGGWCAAHSALMDDWLAGLLLAATAGNDAGVALVAIGGYGRSELCPHSDLDVILVHQRRPGIVEVADAVWYPIWDRGVHLGHSVSTVPEALDLAGADLDTATALLSARHVAGDERLTDRLAGAAREQWRKGSKGWLRHLAIRVEQRHHKAGEVAFRLEPDLKEGRGGLRDVHALTWAEAAQPVLLDLDHASLAEAYAVLLDARVELHRHTGRPINLLALQEQEPVAAALGQGGVESLMAGIAQAGRTIAWTSDDAWRRIRLSLGRPRAGLVRRSRSLASGVTLRDGEVDVDDTALAGEDPDVVLRVALLAARHHATIERHSLERLAAGAAPLPTPWSTRTRSLLVELLLTGHGAIPVIEALDQRGLWADILPEWASVRARPQHNAYHRFTVDRHLLESVANAATLVCRVERPDLLVLGALLHDLGKGFPGDHSETGVTLARDIATRMGFEPEDGGTLADLVRHHLLLPDVATRRDIDDATIIEHVATTVGSVSRLRLLAALTEADAVATGPSAWGPWKARLVGQLVERVTHLLEGGDPDGLPVEPFPTPDQMARLARAGQHIDGHGQMLNVITTDRPGLFSRVAGVLALHGLDVLRASAFSSEGQALSEFHVSDPIRNEIRWPAVVADVELALDGRLAVNARLSERARLYGLHAAPPPRSSAATVSIDNDASAAATVIDVYARDRIGLLYRITRAFADLDLDIRSARVHTLGTQVVDSFYLCDRHGDKVTAPDSLAEIERAVLHSLAD